MSIIGPILFGLMMVVPAWLSTFENSQEKHIAVVDEMNKYDSAFVNTDVIKFDILDNKSEEGIRKSYQEQGYDAYIVINDDLQKNPTGVKLYSEAQVTFEMKNYIERQLKSFLEKERLNSYEIEGLGAIIKEIKNAKVDLITIKLEDDGSEKESSTEIAIFASIIFSMLVYMFVLVYGTQVMRGVMEEKTSRIIEVIISSAKPFHLMMGKIIGIVLVAFTQFALWVVLTLVIMTGINQVVLKGDSSAKLLKNNQEMVGMPNGSIPASISAGAFEHQYTKALEKISALNITGMLFSFLFFFIGGYMLYAALFAAVGSAVDGETDSQQFVLPVMLPLILSIYVAMAAFRDPGSQLAFWFSIIPFTSPIVMMARIPFGVPAWEIALSMVVLVATFVFMVWVASRIYRVGILMYGKKVTYKEIWKWFWFAGR